MKKYLDPTSYCSKYGYKTSRGELKFKLNNVEYFAKTYCNIDLTLVDRFTIENKMCSMYNSFDSFDKNGIPIYEYTNIAKNVSLFD